MAEINFELPKLTPKILVVDDEEEIVKSLNRELRSIGDVHSFLNPKEALSFLLSNEVSVVISDFRMPDLNGLELLAQVAEHSPQTQRILLTAFADLLNTEELINKARLNFLLSKPWEANDLRNAVMQAERQFEVFAENRILRKLALTDPLTEVANRRYFKERLSAEFSRAKRFQRPLSVIMADIDDFKKYNDTWGHAKGDSVLKNVAQVFERSKRLTDTVARYGGEEFVIILPEVGKLQASEIAKRHLEKVKVETQINVSMGVASYPEDAHDEHQLVERADQALLKAKNQGKARVILFEGGHA